jgi:hypothetical protein
LGILLGAEYPAPGAGETPGTGGRSFGIGRSPGSNARVVCARAEDG